MPKDGSHRLNGGGDVASALAALFHRLGFAAVIRHPDTADIIASTPDAEFALRMAEPGTTRIASGRIAGALVRVELVPTPGDAPVRLTRRQLDVARLLADGLRNDDIAERLGISAHTVRRHLEGILRQLNVSNRAAAAKELRTSRADLIGAAK